MGEIQEAFVFTKNVDVFHNGTIDRWLFEKPPSFTAFGIAVPVLCALGVVLNLITFGIYFHSELRSGSSLVLKALLLSDTMYLIMTVITLSPRIWMHEIYARGRYERFWTTLHGIQEVYMICYPLHQVFQVMSGLYSTLLIVEQCATFFIPDKLSKWMEGDGGLKMIVTVLNVIIICHLVVFFKFNEKPVLIIQHFHAYSPNNQTVLNFDAKRMCLSIIYNSTSYQNLERFIFFAVFEVVPWIISFVAFVLCIMQYTKLKKDVGQMPVMDPKWLRLLSSGRSIRTVLTLTAQYLLLKAIAHVVYISTVHEMQYNLNDDSCHLTPIDTRFSKIPIWESYLFTFTLIVNSSIKPWLCIIASFGLRDIASNSSRKCCVSFKTLTRRCCLFLNPCRRTSQESESQMRTFHSNVERY